MLNCHLCLKHYSRALAAVHATRTAAVLPASRTARAFHNGARHGQARQQLDEGPQQHDGALEPGPPRKWQHSQAAQEQKHKMTAVMKSPPKPAEVFNEADLRRELVYLKDPQRLAEKVKKFLQQNRLERAQALVLLASKHGQCTVSWNHVIDYYMDKGHIQDALSTYNDMKKRAQDPDSYTYLLLLRGLANYAHFPQSLGRALSLYHSMSGPKSRTKPNIIHSNTVIKVCARANDSDAMWGIVSKLPEKGAGAADCLTYTLILNQIRNTAILNTTEDEDSDQVARRREKAVLEGRQIWDTIIRRWRSGDLLIDERVTCAMGRLLLVGARPRDWDDVLSLVQQTMNIPRLVPKLHTASREGSIRAPQTPSDMKHPYPNPQREGDLYQPGGEFDPTPESRTAIVTSRSSSLAYAKPTNSTLSLILESCLKTIARGPAKDYWNLLTDQNSYDLQPDLDNFHMYLRVLRQAHASAAALELIRDELPRANLKPMVKTFRIALAACQKDHLNPNAIDNASRLIDQMQMQLDHPDARCLNMFVQLVRTAKSTRDMVRALDRLHPSIVDLHSLISYGRGITPSKLIPPKSDVVLLMTGMISLHDKLLHSNELDRAATKTLEARRAKLAAFVTRAQGISRTDRAGWRQKASSRNAELERARAATEQQQEEEGSSAASDDEAPGLPDTPPVERRPFRLKRHAMEHTAYKTHAV